MPDIKRKSQTQIIMHDVIEISVVLVAAGRGLRASSDIPKQYCHIAGKPLIRHTLDNIRAALPDVTVIVVTNPDDNALFEEATNGLENLQAVSGGSSRQESVLNGLQALEKNAPKYVLVHDAARPFVSKKVIGQLIAKLKGGSEALVPAMVVTDTLKRISNNIIQSTVNRDGLYAVQTPQAFVYDKLIAAHKSTPHNDFTDDAAVFEHAGNTVEICDGDENNFKVTRPEDFMKAENHLMMQCADVRVGSGYDVHAFEAGNQVTLCGVNIPFTRKLKGHSDADVGLHAITDAILSAISAGDIGTHFPPSDEQWRGVESHIFLSHATKLVSDKAGIISHVAITLICEAPKIGPHVQAMREYIAEILSISINRVSVQATTTEKLGFTGREEGIAAQATATVRLPLNQSEQA